MTRVRLAGVVAGRPHLARLGAMCRTLGTRGREHANTRRKPPTAGESEAARKRRQDREEPYMLLGKWAHMLGFRGHFSTKSRKYSITLGALRRARQRYQALVAESQRTGEPLDVRDLEARLLADDTDTTLVVGSWTFHGSGWTQPGDEALALAAAARAREYDAWRATQRKTA